MEKIAKFSSKKDKQEILLLITKRREFMKNKKIIIIFIVILAIILIGGYFIIKYVREKQETTSMQEYTPQEEITDEQFRQTIVTLYFRDKETGQISPEARLVDIREIINNPYEKLINLLIQGPKNEKLQSTMPSDTKILKAYMEGDCLVLDLSKEFLTYSKDASLKKEILIKSIVNTVTELTEVNSVKFLIDGSQNDEFNDIYIRES